MLTLRLGAVPFVFIFVVISSLLAQFALFPAKGQKRLCHLQSFSLHSSRRLLAQLGTIRPSFFQTKYSLKIQFYKLLGLWFYSDFFS